MRDLILNAMNDLMQRNTVCDYLIKFGDNSVLLKEVCSIDAYMQTLDNAKRYKQNVYCFMSVFGKQAASPVFSVESGIVSLSGCEIARIPSSLAGEQ